MDVNVRLKELREERFAAIQESNKITERVLGEGRGLNTEERANVDRLDARADDIGWDDTGGEIARLVKYRERLRAENADDGDLRTVLPDDDGDAPDGEPRSYASLEEFRQAEGLGRQGAQPGYDAAFYRLLQGGMTDRAFHALGEEEQRALSHVTGPDGGYLVPATTENRVIEQADEVSPLRQLCDVITTATGEDINIPLEGDIGDADWVAENTDYPEADIVLALVKLRAFKIATTVFVPRELLTDSVFPLEAYLIRVLGRRIGEAESLAYAVGVPADPANPGKPTGVYGRLAVGAVATGGGAGGVFAAGKPLAGDDLIDLQESVRPAYQGNATWVLSQDAAKAARKLKTNDGQYVLVPGLRDGETDSLLGRPLQRDPFLPAAAAAGTLAAYGDFRAGITIRDVAGVYLQRLNELRAKQGQVGFLADHRTDINITNVAAVKRLAAAAA